MSAALSDVYHFSVFFFFLLSTDDGLPFEPPSVLPPLVGCAATNGGVISMYHSAESHPDNPLSWFTEGFSDPPSPPPLNFCLTGSHHDRCNGKSPRMCDFRVVLTSLKA